MTEIKEKISAEEAIRLSKEARASLAEEVRKSKESLAASAFKRDGESKVILVKSRG
ncbi:MAG: hypothetical protein ACTSXQ_03340 [Alphaproteobacteria bacterium]